MFQFLFTAPKNKVNVWYWYQPKKVSTNIFISFAFFRLWSAIRSILPNVKYSDSKWDRGRRWIEPIVLLVVLCWWFEVLGQVVFWGFGRKRTFYDLPGWIGYFESSHWKNAFLAQHLIESGSKLRQLKDHFTNLDIIALMRNYTTIIRILGRNESKHDSQFSKISKTAFPKIFPLSFFRQNNFPLRGGVGWGGPC